MDKNKMKKNTRNKIVNLLSELMHYPAYLTLLFKFTRWLEKNDKELYAEIFCTFFKISEAETKRVVKEAKERDKK